jgi:hypothetical protein
MENRMSKICVVGCKLVNGIILESGYSVVDGNVVRLPEYKRVRLAGTNQSRLLSGVTNAPLHLTPGITENVDEDFFDKWCIDHADSNIVKNKLIWKARNKSEALAKAADETHRDTGFEPRDQTKLGGDLKPRSDNDDVV